MPKSGLNIHVALLHTINLGSKILPTLSRRIRVNSI